MKKSNKSIAFLTGISLILLMGVLLRLYKLDQFPTQLNRDEAALAINAQFINKAGVDEWGRRFPTQFQSFGDYKLPGYIYLLSALFHFQSSDLMARIPSALAGIFLTALIPLFTFTLFKQKLHTYTYVFVVLSAVLTPFLFFYSRMAWEANVGLALLIAGLIPLYKATPNLKHDLISCVLLLAATLTYNTPFLLLPFIILSIPFYRRVKTYKSWLPVTLLLSMIFVSVFLILRENNSQKSHILFFSNPTVIDNYPDYRSIFHPALQTILGNKYVYFAQIGLSNYINTFTPHFLVTNGGAHPWHSILGRGHLYWVTYMFFILGVVVMGVKGTQTLLKNPQKGFSILQKHRAYVLLLFLLFVSPLPAVLTVDAPHATRSLFTLVFIVVISSIGWQFTINVFSKLHRFGVSIARFSIILILLLESFYYYDEYFAVWSQHYPPEFNIGLSQVISQAVEKYPDEQIQIVSDDLYLYATVAWYAKVTAEATMQTIERSEPDTIGLYRVLKLGQFQFVQTGLPESQKSNRQIYQDDTTGWWYLE